jgi:hypothetical protein
MKKIKLTDLTIESFITRINKTESETIIAGSEVIPGPDTKICTTPVCPPGNNTNVIEDSVCYICYVTKGQHPCSAGA